LLAETRAHAKALNHYTIQKSRWLAYHEHNELTRAPETCGGHGNKGARSLLVSDAGVCLVGERTPGFRIGDALFYAPTFPVNFRFLGPAALLAALLTASGFGEWRNFFSLGFYPPRGGERRACRWNGFSPRGSHDYFLTSSRTDRRRHLSNGERDLGGRSGLLGRRAKVGDGKSTKSSAVVRWLDWMFPGGQTAGGRGRNYLAHRTVFPRTGKFRARDNSQSLRGPS